MCSNSSGTLCARFDDGEMDEGRWRGGKRIDRAEDKMRAQMILVIE